jgi:hypothetical protein
MLQRRSSIDQTSIEEDPARACISGFPVRERNLNRTPGKCDGIHPRQRSAVSNQFLGNDPSPWFVDGGKTASPKLAQQRRFTATGTA